MKIEWIDWHKTMRLLIAADVGVMPWRTIADWCGQGLIETRGATVVAFGAVIHDHPIAPSVWQQCQRAGVGHVSGGEGAIRCSARHPETGEPGNISVLGPTFRKDQVLRLMPHVSRDAINAALFQEGKWLDIGNRSPAVSDAPSPALKGPGGMKKDTSAWDSFWMAVVELALQERLNGRQFADQAELRAEILEMINDALKERTIKPVVSQIWNRWIEPSR